MSSRYARRLGSVGIGRQMIDAWMVIQTDEVPLQELIAAGFDRLNPSSFGEKSRDARMKSVEGPETPLPDLLMMMTLGRSWIARGMHDGNVDDLRRTMRLGRLLRQDDLTFIQELIGVAVIRMSANAMYDMARSKDDTVQTTLASLAITDSTAIRLETMNRSHGLNAGELTEAAGVIAEIFGPSSRLRAEEVDNLVAMAEQAADRRFRFEAMGQLYVARNTAGGDLKKKAVAALAKLQNDRDPIIAANARWYASAKWNPKEWNISAK